MAWYDTLSMIECNNLIFHVEYYRLQIMQQNSLKMFVMTSFHDCAALTDFFLLFVNSSSNGKWKLCPKFKEVQVPDMIWKTLLSIAG